MKNTIFKYKKYLVPCLFVFTLSACSEAYKDELVDYINPQASIYVLRSNYKGEDLKITESTLEGSKYVGGVVISNHENKNLPQNTIAIQSIWRGKTRGVLVEVNDPTNFVFGDSISLDIIGSTLTRKLGSLAVTNISNDKITKVGKGIIKKHVPVAISTLEKKQDEFESTLISITADVNPEPSKGTTLAGDHELLDGENKKIKLTVNKDASFAAASLSPSATFQGILFDNNGVLELKMQKADDLTFPSGKLYTGWPETFEDPYQFKTSYNVTATANLVTYPTGIWYQLQSIQGETVGRDRIVSGKQAIRFQQNLNSSAYLQMNFDMPDGASKVTFWYGAYYTDRSSTFQLEYSIDQGKTWKIVDKPITDAHSTSVSLVAKQAVFLMDIDVPVRFRINKLGIGTSSNTVNNGRLGLDDFAIYKSY